MDTSPAKSESTTTDSAKADTPRERARAFGAREVAPSAALRDREARWEGALFRRLGAAGFLAPGLSADGTGAVSGRELSELLTGFGEGSEDAGLSLAWAAHTTGCVVPLARLGTDVQRREWLPSLLAGKAVGAWAHCETLPAAEREAAPTGVGVRAVRRGAGWVLDGAKTRVVNGSVAEVFLVTAVTDPAMKERGVSAFLVPRATPGLSIKRLDTVGLRSAVLSEIALDGCEVGESHLLGAEGAGLLATARLVQRWERVALFAPWVGLMRLLLDRTVGEMREAGRVGRPLAQFQSARARLADMKIRIEIGERLAARAARHLDREPPEGDVDIAVSRLVLAQSVQETLREALSAHGLNGAGAGQLTARLHRDAAVLGLVGGDDDRVRSAIAGALLGLG